MSDLSAKIGSTEEFAFNAIDSHIHCGSKIAGKNSRLLPEEPALIAERLKGEMARSKTDYALVMGALSSDKHDPLGIGKGKAVAQHLPQLGQIGIANPHESHDTDYLSRVRQEIEGGSVRALKAYLGYVHAFPNDERYRPYYDFAKQHNLPFIFHTGDTFSRKAKLKYAMPIHVDEVAVDYPDVQFVLAHVGNPWCMDAAEVIYKNDNVWADVSAIFVPESEDDPDAAERTKTKTGDRLLEAWDFAAKPNRFLFGTDWPLIDMAECRRRIAKVISAEHHQAVFADNARTLFRLTV